VGKSGKSERGTGGRAGGSDGADVKGDGAGRRLGEGGSNTITLTVLKQSGLGDWAANILPFPQAPSELPPEGAVLSAVVVFAHGPVLRLESRLHPYDVVGMSQGFADPVGGETLDEGASLTAPVRRNRFTRVKEQGM
jgi:hypothetical protein